MRAVPAQKQLGQLEPGVRNRHVCAHLVARWVIASQHRFLHACLLHVRMAVHRLSHLPCHVPTFAPEQTHSASSPLTWARERQ